MAVVFKTTADYAAEFADASANHKQALQTATQLAQSSPSQAITALEQALAPIESHDTLRELLRRERVEALCLLAECHAGQDNRPAAAAAYKRALAIEPNNLGLWNKFGAFYESRSDFANAAACFERSVAIDPRTTGIIGKATALYHIGRTNDALLTVRQLLQKNLERTHEPTIQKAVILFLAIGSEHDTDLKLKDALQKKIRPPVFRQYELAAFHFDRQVSREAQRELGQQATFAGHRQFTNK